MEDFYAEMGDLEEDAPASEPEAPKEDPSPPEPEAPKEEPSVPELEVPKEDPSPPEPDAPEEIWEEASRSRKLPAWI